MNLNAIKSCGGIAIDQVCNFTSYLTTKGGPIAKKIYDLAVTFLKNAPSYGMTGINHSISFCKYVKTNPLGAGLVCLALGIIGISAYTYYNSETPQPQKT